MMAGLPDFRARQAELSKRLGRQNGRTLLRRRLERELRGLVEAELHAELRVASTQAGQDTDDDEARLQWWQK